MRAGSDATMERSADDTAVRESRDQEAEVAYRPGPVDEAGVVRGEVRYEGDPPDARAVTVPEDIRSVCGERVALEPIEVGDRGGLGGAVVSVRGLSRGRPFSESTAVLDQEGCRFEPQVVVLPVDGELTVKNSDPFTHNVHTVTFENRPVNRSQPPGVDLSLRFAAPERLRVECDIHGWMGASVVVSHHPYHAVADAAGGFVLQDVPPGTYTLEAWHPELGIVEREVTVRAGDSSSVTLTYRRSDGAS